MRGGHAPAGRGRVQRTADLNDNIQALPANGNQFIAEPDGQLQCCSSCSPAHRMHSCMS